MANWPGDFTSCDNIFECFNKSMNLRERYPYVTYYLPHQDHNRYEDCDYGCEPVDDENDSRMWCDISKSDWSTFENTEEMVVFWLTRHGIILKMEKCNGFAQCLKMGVRAMANSNNVYLTFGITGMGYYNDLVRSFNSPYDVFYISSTDKRNMLRSIEYREHHPICHD
jgi:hypothetical protein